MSFEIAGGTVGGRAHALAGKPNQDAYAWFVREDRELLVAVVCDGCGSGAHSEVGAQLGARLVTARLAARIAEGAFRDSPAPWDDLGREVLGVIGKVASAMGGRLSEVVSDYFLFTVVGFAVDGERGWVFAAGDGIAAVDGAQIQLGPFPRNEPPYLGYGLLDDRAPGIVEVRTFDARSVETLCIGTDGAGDLDEPTLHGLWEEDRHFENRDAIRRQLALMNREVQRPIWEERRIERERGCLEDDTTVVVARRRKSYGRLSAQ